MTRTRRDVLNEAHDAWNRGDLEALRACYAPDITADAGLLWPSSGPLSGPEPILGTFTSIREAFETSEVIPEDYIERGDTIIVPSRWRGVVAGSGTVIEQHVVASYTFRGVMISHIAYFEQVDDALRALEQD